MKNLTLKSSIWIDNKRNPLLGKGRIELLKLVEKTGSLLKASKEMKMSYKAAWDAIASMNAAADVPLLQSSSGGKNGGGSSLTDAGRAYIKLYDKIYEEQQKFFASLEEHLDNFDKFSNFTKRSSVRTSARNQICGTIESIKKDGFNAEVAIDIGDMTLLKAVVTTKSVAELGLRKNSKLWCIIKISWVEIVEKNEKADNVFDATIENIKEQNDNFEAELRLKNGVKFVASLKNNANNLKKWDAVNIFIDKSHIILGI